jgi:hypothetical protein
LTTPASRQNAVGTYLCFWFNFEFFYGLFVRFSTPQHKNLLEKVMSNTFCKKIEWEKNFVPAIWSFDFVYRVFCRFSA